MSAVALGVRLRTMIALRRVGLYSALGTCLTISVRSSVQHRLHVATTFRIRGTMLLVGTVCSVPAVVLGGASTVGDVCDMHAFGAISD